MSQELAICSLCRRVQGPDAQWSDLGTYMERCSVPPSAIIFSPGYCPDCDESYRLLMTYGRADHAVYHHVA
ncbi:MAG TPA: hypothetical protein VFS39_08740 [Nitrospira sp.]|nr:hypothetical protein [Nitrospira sp.]